MWAFGAYLALLASVWTIAGGIRPSWLAPRMLIELPFVVLAVLLPFAESGGERVVVAGISLSVPGLYAAWGGSSSKAPSESSCP